MIWSSFRVPEWSGSGYEFWLLYAWWLLLALEFCSINHEPAYLRIHKAYFQHLTSISAVPVHKVYASFINCICSLHFLAFPGDSSYERRGKKKSSQLMFSNHFVDGRDAFCLSIFSSIEHRASKFAFMVTWYGGVFFSWLDQITSSTPWHEPVACDIKQKAILDSHSNIPVRYPSPQQ